MPGEEAARGVAQMQASLKSEQDRIRQEVDAAWERTDDDDANWICGRCGAIVRSDFMDRHRDWHVRHVT